MKKMILFPALLASIFGTAAAWAATTTICNNGVMTVPASGTAGTHYMTSAINPRCSPATYVSGVDGTNGGWYAVGATTAKGKSTFGGNSRGGTLVQANCAIKGGCTNDEADDARDTASNTASALSD